MTAPTASDLSSADPSAFDTAAADPSDTDPSAIVASDTDASATDSPRGDSPGTDPPADDRPLPRNPLQDATAATPAELKTTRTAPLAAATVTATATPRGTLLIAAVLMLLLMWLSTGTLPPYANTLDGPFVVDGGYLVNIDHFHFLSTYRMLDGAPPQQYQSSVVLRRTLYPLLAYGPMKILGYLPGGLLTNALLHLFALSVFTRAVARELGRQAARLGALAVACYPGLTYWAGLPYSYAIIVPASLLLLVLIWRLRRARQWWAVALLSLGMGVLFCGYDLLLPFFGLPALLGLAARRRWRWLPLAGVCMIGPTVANLLILHVAYQVPLKNDNTSIYGIVLRAYLAPPDSAAWLRLLKNVPLDAVANFFYSNFFFLPGAALVAWGVSAIVLRVKHPVEEWAVLAMALGLFLFTDCAPPYTAQWVIRGDGFGRFYQPIFVVLLVMILRVTRRAIDAGGRVERVAIVNVLVMLLGNAVICLGPITDNPLAGEIYHAFYRHGPPGAMSKNLTRYGRRPYGFTSAAVPPTPETPRLKKKWTRRYAE